MSLPLLEPDRRLLTERTKSLWEETRVRRIFVTGGTGFFGRWLLEALTAASDDLGLGLTVTVLTRNPSAFRIRAGCLASHPSIGLLRGDVRDFAIPEGRWDCVIHAAFASSREPGPEETRSTIVDGTARCLDFARRAGAKRFLLVSSGAVYGRQPSEKSRLCEEDAEAPGLAQVRTAYGQAKREAEALAVAAGKWGLQAPIARGFAFVGPHLPLDRHFAVGNFIRDALAGGPIRIRGDGAAVRSYLYAAELAVWLLTILIRGRGGAAYNVGSEQEVTIEELARRVAGVFGPAIGVEIASKPPGRPSDRYVPSTHRAREELGLEQEVGLEEALQRTRSWYLGSGPGREATVDKDRAREDGT